MQPMMRLRTALLAAAMTVCLPMAHALAEVQEIDGVEVDATGPSGTAARDAAFKIARVKAVEELYRRAGMTPPGKIDPAKAEAATVFVDVNKEKVSGGTYKATLTVGIDPAMISADLAAAAATMAPASAGGVTVDPGYPGPQGGQPPVQAANDGPLGRPTPYTDAGEVAGAPDWIVIVPAHVDVYGQTGWGSDDPWVQSWQSAGNAASSGLKLVPTPADAADRQSMAGHSPSMATAAELQAIAAKSGAPAAALVVLETQTEASGNTPAYGTVFLRYWSPQTGFKESQRTVSGADLVTVARAAELSALADAMAGAPPAADAQAYSATVPAVEPGLQPDGGTWPGAQTGSAPADSDDRVDDSYNPSAPAYQLPDRYNGGTVAATPTAPGEIPRYPGSAPATNGWPTPQVPSYQGGYAPAAAAGATTVPFSFSIDSVDRWISIRHEIEAIPGASVTPIRLSRTRVDIMVRFTGDETTLRRQMAARGLVVE